MTIAIETIMPAIIAVVIAEPIGTNLGLLHLLWMMVTGKGLNSRGALFPGLQASGLKPAEIYRAWGALRYGDWQISDLLAAWYDYVQGQGQWQAKRYEKWRVKAVDITAFFRPALKGCQTKHYYGPAEKALPAIPIGLVAEVGQVGEQRLALPVGMIRAVADDPREHSLQAQLLKQVAQHLGVDEVGVLDAGFDPREIEAAGLPQVVLRLAKNATFRRNYLPERKERGRPPEYGELVRPLARQRKKRPSPAPRLITSRPLSRMGKPSPWSCGKIWCSAIINQIQPILSGRSSRFIIPIINAPYCWAIPSRSNSCLHPI